VWIASARQFTLWTRGGGTSHTAFALRKGFDRTLFAPDRGTLVSLNSREEKVLVRELPAGRDRIVLNLKLPEPRLWTVAPGAAWFAHTDPRPNHKRLHVLDGRTGKPRLTREFDEQVGGLAPSPDGRLVAVGLSEPGRGLNSKVVLFDAMTGERAASLPVQKKGLMALVFSADGRYLAVGFNGLVQVWDVRERELVRSITGFERVPTCLEFSPDAKSLAAGTQDGLVWLWSVATGKPFQRLEVGPRGVRSIAFDKAGKRLITVANAAPVSIWNVAEVVGEGDVQ
jgi:WD40 repeat protein